MQPARKRSKAEVMEEVIAKSKAHKVRRCDTIVSNRVLTKNFKFQRQAQHEEDENLRHELDQELDSIRSLLFAADVDPSDGKLLRDSVDVAQDEDREYDHFVRELNLDQRAKPKDRTKTEEELAVEAKEALEKAERKRIRRMNGEEDDSDDENRTTMRARTRQRGGDDLEDDFEADDDAGWNDLGAGLAKSHNIQTVDESGEDSEDGEDDEDDEDDEGRESDESSEDEAREPGDEAFLSASEDTPEEDEGIAPDVLVLPLKKSSAKAEKAPQELPFTFACPSSHEEFLEIVEHIHEKDIPTIVQRIRTLHHPSLALENKIKLQVSRASFSWPSLTLVRRH